MALAQTKEELALVANTIRMLSADAVEKANSGHPGMPMGMAELATVLWLKHLRFNPEDPKWLDRDRFVLSNGHGSMLLYSMLHLSGYQLSLEDLKSFRQWESKTPGHPECFMTPGVETTTGPLGQGISNAVGMAIGQRVFASRYNTSDRNIFDHRVFCFAGDGCLMEGVSGEGSSIAGHLGLGNLIVIYDSNHISIAGNTNLAYSEDAAKRHQAYGWHTIEIDGHDFDAIDQAYAEAIAEDSKPTLIIAETTIGKGSPNKANTGGVHGAPLGADEMELTKKNLNWPLEPTFYIPDSVPGLFQARVEELKADYQSWQESFSSWQSENADLAQQFEKQVSLSVPEDLDEKFQATLPDSGKAVATRKLSGGVLQVASKEVNALIGGSADLEPSTLTLIKDSTDISSGQFSGVNLRFGVREHGMGAIMNGLSCYGGFIPYGSTFLCFADYMRPSIRLAALSHLPGLFIFTHDSVFLGEDGPTHQPIEHLNALRMIPNLFLMRPADGVETAVCYRIALERRDGPCALIFTRQGLEQIPHSESAGPDAVSKGGYTLVEAQSGSPEIVIIATGSEVSLAVAAREKLENSSAVRVVSMPCVELFQAQSEDYRNSIIPKSAKKVVIEAGSSVGWLNFLQLDSSDTLLVGIDRFGASAPYKVIAEQFGFTPEAVSKRIRDHFAS